MNVQGNARPLFKQHSLWMYALAALERESIVLHIVSEVHSLKNKLELPGSLCPKQNR